MSEVTLTILDHEGTTHSLTCPAGSVLMQVLRDDLDPEIGVCGGEISCGTCLVALDKAWAAHVTPPGVDEVEMLEALDAPDDARLGCQIILDDNADGLQATLIHED